MSTIELNGTTVFVSAIESVEDGVSHEYDRLWDKVVSERMFAVRIVSSIEDLHKIEQKRDKAAFPKAEDYPAVIVKLTSGREFRIVGKTRKEVEQDILWAKRRDRS